MPPDKSDKAQRHSDKPHKHHEMAAHDPEVQRALNTPENATRAVAASRANVDRLVAGKVWRHRTKHGDSEIKGALMLDEAAVIVLHFNPEDGSILPKGLRGLSEGKPDILTIVEARLQESAKQITILDGAEFREPESCWAVPVAHQGRIVAHMKVSSDGSTILPDKKAIEEANRPAEQS